MLRIDGSYLEGGGQIVRNSFSLSSLLGWPVCVFNIRKGRPKPGLMAQHLQSVQLVTEVCQGKSQDAYQGSIEVQLLPGGLFPLEKVSADPKTAGSVSLMLQAAIFPCLVTRSELDLRGGTLVDFSPPINYLTDVLFPIFKERWGIEAALKVHRHGFFPKGGGHVTGSILSESINWPLHPIDWTGSQGEVKEVLVTILSRNRSIASELEELVRAELSKDFGKTLKIDASDVGHEASYLSVTATTDRNCRFFASALWEHSRGKISPQMAVRNMAESLRKDLAAKGVVDEHTQDQLVLPMILAAGTSRLAVGKLTDHSRTGLWVGQQFGAQFKETTDEEGRVVIEVTGLAFTCHSIRIEKTPSEETFWTDLQMLESKTWATIRVQNDIAQIRGTQDAVEAAEKELHQILKFYGQQR